MYQRFIDPNSKICPANIMSGIPVWETRINYGPSTMLLHRILDLVWMENCAGSCVVESSVEFTLPEMKSGVE